MVKAVEQTHNIFTAHPAGDCSFFIHHSEQANLILCSISIVLGGALDLQRHELVGVGVGEGLIRSEPHSGEVAIAEFLLDNITTLVEDVANADGVITTCGVK